jgi:hypothetical protein
LDDIARKLASFSWPYASQDPVALREIASRVAAVGRRRALLTYSELVSGLEFNIPSVNNGRALRLGVPDWPDLHRAIIGDFLGRLCLDTYTAGQFMGSALVVSSADRTPSEGYRDLMRQLGLLHGRDEIQFLEHWVRETEKAYAWYSQHAV